MIDTNSVIMIVGAVVAVVGITVGVLRTEWREAAHAQIDYLTQEVAKLRKQQIAQDFLFYLVPGVIALILFGTFGWNSIADSNYTPPDTMASAMLVVIGYFFGKVSPGSLRSIR